MITGDWADEEVLEVWNDNNGSLLKNLAAALRKARADGKREGIAEAIDMMDEPHISVLAASEKQ